MLVGRRRLAAIIVLSLSIVVIALAPLAGWRAVLPVLVALTALGVGRSLIDGTRVVLPGLAALFVSLLATTVRPLRRADANANVAIVAIRLLRAIPIFTALTPPAIEGVARAASLVRVEAQHRVTVQGEAGSAYYAVVVGTLGVAVDARPVRRLVRGDGFGEIALILDVSRTATVTCITTSALLAIERHAFLIAVTGNDRAHQSTWSHIELLEVEGARDEVLGRRPID